MPTREEMQRELRQQRASAAPTVSPDILGHTKLAKQARIQDARNKHEALTNPHHHNFSQVVDIGTDAVYSTLPANAAKLNETQEFTIDGEATPDPQYVTVLTYEVPLGRVLYLKHVDLVFTWIDSDGAVFASGVIPGALVHMTIKVNGSADLYNQQMLIDPLSNGIDCHIIAGAGQTVKISVRAGSNLTLGNLYGYCAITGDVLLGNNMPEPYTALLPRGAR